MPDLFDSDPIPADALNPGSDFDFMSWLAKHPGERIQEIARTVIAPLKAEGVARFGAVGYCFGARVSFDLAFNKELDVVAVSHPSLLKIPDDLEVSVTTAESFV